MHNLIIKYLFGCFNQFIGILDAEIQSFSLDLKLWKSEYMNNPRRQPGGRATKCLLALKERQVIILGSIGCRS
jgi:hypothetical protein